MEIGVLSQEDPSNGNGTGGSTDGGDGDIHVENTDQFFEDEYGTRDGSVKRCRQACPGAGCQKDSGLMFVAAGDFREQMTDAGANMYGGAFPAQGQAAANGQNTPDKLDRGNAGWVTRPPLFQLVFDMRNPAATGLW